MSTKVRSAPYLKDLSVPKPRILTKFGQSTLPCGISKVKMLVVYVAFNFRKHANLIEVGLFSLMWFVDFEAQGTFLLDMNVVVRYSI